MKTIKNNITNEIIIKNSRFITKLIKIKDTNIDKYINEAKVEYPKATHYCYCYRTINFQKSSDDGEPGGTAGLPMLNVLIKEDLINVLAITIRYFGGIKLGAGGLVRAYTKSITSALEISEPQELIKGYLIKIIINYEEQKQLDYLLKNANIIDKIYDNNVIYKVEITKDKLEQLSNYNIEIIEERLIDKINE